MHDDEVERSRRGRRFRALTVVKIVPTIIVATVALVVMIVAAVTVLLWLGLGAMLWLVGAAAGVAKPEGGRRLRSTGLRLLRSGPSRWLVRAALHRVRRAWNRDGR
jgi:hypothetical protein